MFPLPRVEFQFDISLEFTGFLTFTSFQSGDYFDCSSEYLVIVEELFSRRFKQRLDAFFVFSLESQSAARFSDDLTSARPNAQLNNILFVAFARRAVRIRK